MFPNPGNMNNMLVGEYAAPVFLGSKTIQNTNDRGTRYPLNLSSIPGIQPGDFVFMEAMRASLAESVTGGDGGWSRTYSPGSTGIYGQEGQLWKAALTQKDIDSSSLYLPITSHVNILAYRGVRVATLRSQVGGQAPEGTPNPTSPVYVGHPAYEKNSDTIGVLCTVNSRTNGTITFLPNNFQPSGVTANSRLYYNPGNPPAYWSSRIFDMLTDARTFGEAFQFTVAGRSYYSTTLWELRA